MNKILNIETLKNIKIIIHHLNHQKTILKKTNITIHLSILSITLIHIQKRMKKHFLQIMKIILIKMK